MIIAYGLAQGCARRDIYHVLFVHSPGKQTVTLRSLPTPIPQESRLSEHRRILAVPDFGALPSQEYRAASRTFNRCGPMPNL